MPWGSDSTRQGTPHPWRQDLRRSISQHLNNAASVEDSYLVWAQGYKEGNEDPNTQTNAYKSCLASRVFFLREGQGMPVFGSVEQLT